MTSAIYIGGDTDVAVIEAVTDITIGSPLPVKPEYIKVGDFNPSRHFLLDETLTPVKVVKITQCLAPAVEILHGQWPDPITVGYETRVCVGVEYFLTAPTRVRRQSTPAVTKFYKTQTVDAVKLAESHDRKKSIANAFTPVFNLCTVPTNPPESKAILKFVEGLIPFSYELGYTFGAFATTGMISSGSAIFRFAKPSLYDLIRSAFPFLHHGEVTRIGDLTYISHTGIVNLLRLFRPPTNTAEGSVPLQFRNGVGKDYVKGVLDGLLHQQHQSGSNSGSGSNSNTKNRAQSIIWCCETLGLPYKFDHTDSTIKVNTVDTTDVTEPLDLLDSDRFCIVKVRQIPDANNLYCLHVSTTEPAKIIVGGGLLIALNTK